MCSSTNSTNSKGWPEHLLDIYTGYQKSQILFVTTNLELYDLLDNCDGGMTVFEIACKKNINLDAIERILDLAAGLKLIKKDAGSDPVYSNIPEVANALQAHKPNNMVAAVLYASRIQYPLFQQLMTVIKDGNNTQAYKDAFGFEVTSETYGSLYSSDPDYTANFIQFMHDLSSITAPGVAKSFDISPFRRICDLGGGSGAIAYALASEYPNTSVAVFDLPSVIERAQNIRPEHSKVLKVEFVAGDFFKDEFPQANLYILARIVHNWEEDKVHQLLKKSFNSLESGGAVLIVERLLNETKTGPLSTLVSNVAMLTSMTGKERTEKEYRQLLEQHGFVDFRCHVVVGESRPLHAMLAYKQ
ncbi:acetylserotonin O-methyltransferase-like isoform X2 [Anneissia japonica]|uniref:acetylserotonin O-methyltransferase-like isoform X2 n=1 Tax=Anneissia japonica TaxID=1529436 RepID=UPI0014257540|nr:acetylserotonin O-methyltransferase-like isoform X2 [Anneissia japonica]